MLFLLFLACATHVQAVTVLGEPKGADAHYLIVDDDGLAWDCRSMPRGPNQWEPTCVRVKYRDDAPGASETPAAEDK